MAFQERGHGGLLVRRRRGLTDTDNRRLHAGGTLAADRAAEAVFDLRGAHVELSEGAAEGVAVHAQLTGGAALIAFIFLEHGEDKPLLKLTHALGVEDVAFVHLQNKCFQLIFHSRFLSSFLIFNVVPKYSA